MPSSENTNETSTARMSDFPGLVVNADPRDLPLGAGQTQVNVTSEQSGVLKSRLGLVEVTFEG